MQILAIRPDRWSSGKTRTLALFDIAISADCRLYNLRLIETPDGRRLSYAPNAHGTRTATFTHKLASEITDAASAALDGSSDARNDQRTA
jgi:hypothetical protein